MSQTIPIVTLPTLPLKSSVLFPRLLMPLAVGRPASVAAVEAALASEDKTLAVFAQKDPLVEEPTVDDLHRIGTLAVIKKMERSGESVQLIVQGVDRLELVELSQTTPYLAAQARRIPEPKDFDTELEALHREILKLAAQVHALVAPEAQMGITQIIMQVQDPLHQTYLLASMLNLDMQKEQALLEAPTRVEALRLLHTYLTHEVQVLELRNKIASQAQSEISREQREYVLRQQKRAIEEELGETDPEEAELTELRRRLEEANLPEEVLKEAQRELGRLERLPQAAPDYQLTRAYLELITELPWQRLSEDVLDLPLARRILDEDHYGLKEIKERIVEHLAVLKLNPKAKSPILCFIGPPGVGKTSLGQSIARALGRKFERLSLGGMHDEAELRGHRRTYIGAMPGRIIQAVRRAGVRNPLLMLDEVDKLGRDFRGDPASALLEILDPAQNYDFHDNYLDLPFDLSKVFFITTANTLDTIPQPLLDRMEVIRLSGYSDEEKVQIARRYLLGRQRSEAGLTEEQLTVPDETVARVIRRYTREAGVRQLERQLGRIARKVATRFAEGRTDPVAVQPDDLKELLGAERFFEEQARRESAPGVTAGLAWTEAGGDVLYVEAVLLPEGSGLTLTGQLGEVMQESAKAAKSYLWSQAAELGIDKESFSKSGVHIHVPAGAIRKDGPSAGVTMTTALASLFLNAPVRSDTAMTGEITLSGLVMPVGGIKEKVLAAHRAGIRRVILPKENAKDLEELEEHVRQQMEFVLAERIEDVLAAAIPTLAEHLEPALV
jgi:ATP-dependent Lon protease